MNTDREYLAVSLGINDYQKNLKERIKWLLILRVIIVTFLLGSLSLVQIKYDHSSLTPFYLIIAITYLLTILYAVLYHNLNNLMVFAYIQLIGDILIETCLIYFTGGIESTLSFTYIITIITASIVLSRKGSLIIASICSIIYGLLLDFQYFGILVLPLSYIPKYSSLTSTYVFHTIFVNICGYFLTALLSGYLAESRKKVNQALIAREEDLLELRAFNEDILKCMHSGLIVTDMNGQVTLANIPATEILNLKKTSEKRLLWGDLFSPIDFQKTFQILLDTPGHLLKYNEFINLKKKENCFLGLTISFLKDAKGEKKGVIACFQDLTEFKKMEEQVKQAEILATIGGMAAGIAHELRNPIASIKGSIQLLAESTELDKAQGRLIEIILKESTRLNSIISEFLIYARPKPPNLELCDINSLINDIITMLKNMEDIQQNIRIHLELEPVNNYLQMDMNQIRQVLWNLAINAYQAMPHGGTLTILTCTQKKERESWKIIEIKDTGIGIPKEYMSKLFHPFFTTKDDGTGLGLGIAYRIIEGHKGKIEAESKPGEGSIFRVYVPL